MHVHRNRAAGCLRAGLAALVFAGSGLLPTIAGATDFNASGSVSFNGHAANLADGLFIGSSYATATGAVGAGHFKFVGASVGDGTVALVFDLGQANTSSGLVTANGAASLANASLILSVTSATYNGSPIVVGADCVFQPVNVVLHGDGTLTALDLGASGFTVPAIDGNACNGFAAAIGNVLVGNDTDIVLQVDGDFDPPGTLFDYGFEPVR